MTSELGAELSTIARSGRADAALDALALLADAYFFQSAGLWTVGVAALHWRGGFGVPDTRAIPEELWGPELTRAVHEARVERVEPAPVGWSHGESPHVIVPLTSSEGVTRGVLIASAETLGRARHARVTAGRSEGDLLVLVVEDDGHGASAEELEAARVRGGLGVAAIEGHAMLRGGTVSVGPSELGGLRLEVALPGI